MEEPQKLKKALKDSLQKAPEGFNIRVMKSIQELPQKESVWEKIKQSNLIIGAIIVINAMIVAYHIPWYKTPVDLSIIFKNAGLSTLNVGMILLTGLLGAFLLWLDMYLKQRRKINS